MSQRIFDSAPLRGAITANIEAILPCPQGVSLLLDRTIFFPRGGGQLCDDGTIGGVPVLDVFEEDGVIHHILPSAPPSQRNVLCQIDLAKRLSHMQHHTGQHLISALAERLFQNPTLIARMEEPYAHIEFTKPVDLDELDRLSAAVSQVVAQALPIHCRYYTPEEAAAIKVRGKITPHERIRLVEVENFDCNACGGTHCPDTSMVGPIRFVGSKMVRGAFRLYFVAGKKAEEFALAQDRSALQLGQLFSCESPEETQKKICDMHQRLPLVEADNHRLRQQLLAAQEENLFRLAQEHPGTPAVFQVLENWEIKDAKALCDSLTRRCPMLVALGLLQQDRLGIVVAQQKGMDKLSPGRLFRDFFSRHGGKGGGGDALCQGTVPFSQEALEDFNALCQQMLDILAES